VKSGIRVRTFESVVIGGGPAGLVCALELSRSGRSVALLEQGGRIAESLCPVVACEAARPGGDLRKGARARAQCGRCTCLVGIGGAAMHFDSDLGYIRRLARAKIELNEQGAVQSYSHLERALGSLEAADIGVRHTYDLFRVYGLPLDRAAPTSCVSETLRHQSVFEHVDTSESFLMTLDMALSMVGTMERDIERLGGALFVHHTADDIGHGRLRRWRVLGTDSSEERFEIETDNVVLAVGKIALPWLLECVQRVGIVSRPSAAVEIGVRLESRAQDFEPLTDNCRCPKLSFISRRGDTVRTFCVCVGGRLMQYEFAGAMILDGQHCYEDPTSYTNMGILTRARSDDGTKVGIDLARQVTAVGAGRPVVQTVGDFWRQTPTTVLPQVGEGTLRLRTLGNLHDCLPDFLIADIADMIARLNVLSPGMVKPSALLAAPIVERVQPEFILDEQLQTSQSGIYMIGDCSGKVIGITYGAATGLCAARAIVKEMCLQRNQLGQRS
jgi:uncharacterized protein